MSLHHDMLVGAWRNIAHDAEVATSVEPHLWHLRRGGKRNGVVDSCGNIMMADTVRITEVLVVQRRRRRCTQLGPLWRLHVTGPSAQISRAGRHYGGIRSGAPVG
jgi:hypothetical protein